MNFEKKPESVFSKRVKAGSKRTYFFDVRPNRKGDFFISVTESRKILNEEGGYEKNKIFVYKEDFNKFLKALEESIQYVKTELAPDFDFTAFDRSDDEDEEFSERKDHFKSENHFEENDKL